MKRALIGFVSLGLGVFAQSCVEDTAGVYVSRVLKADDDCAFTADSMTLGNPTYDFRVAQPYYVTLGVESQLRSRQTALGADPFGVQISSADVTLLSLDGSPLTLSVANPFRLPASGFIPSSADGTPVRQFVSVVIPAEAMAAIEFAPGGFMVVRVELHGKTTGTIDIDTDPFEFTIGAAYLCHGTASSSCMPGQDGHTYALPGGFCPSP